MFRMRTRGNDNVIEIDEENLLTHSGKDHARSASEGSWRPFQSEQHAQMAERTHVHSEGGLIPVLWSARDCHYPELQSSAVKTAASAG